MSVAWALLQRDVGLFVTRGHAVLLSAAFFFMAASLFPFAVGPDRMALAPLAGGVIWVIALFAGLLNLEKMYGPDFQDGSLDQLAILPLPLWWVALSRAAAHWIACFLPLLVFTPMAGILLGLPLPAALTLCVALAVGTPALSLIGGVGAALTLGLRQAALVLTLVVLPLMLPTLIFGAALVGPDLGTIASGSGALSLLAAVSLITLVICPIATVAALRLALR